MSISRRQVIQSAGASALLASVGQQAMAQAQIENLKIVTGFAAGGTSDTTCRRVATKLGGSYAKTATVENKTGAGGQIAIQYVKGQPADGATMLQTPTSMLTIYPHIYKKLPYDPINDITPVSLACVFDFGFAVGPMVPANVKNIADFIVWAKANPSQANFGSPAAGSTPHFVGALLGRHAGVDLKHVGYRGTQPAMLDLLGGQIAAVCGPIGDITQHLPTGKVRILATSGAKRNRFAPDVPTFTEQGLKDMEHSEWFAFFLPGKAAPDVVARLNSAVKAALASKDVIDGMGTFGLETMSSSPAELATILKKDTVKWGPIVKAIGFTADA
ncbi:MAG: Bug family tripartite tricarboxylate transporter substrate binding protein [Rhodoferax sp.]|uniref:Bug family tripartite tricarboxylate transporter substrate binding protein n=1 Tax=Rhodoferax sp. TaxID=50421 RepID=UPI0027316238|nr:Bug family tripartite tricarboxylate transporter substrate binding protein [Rhodoferax sp.]MDP1527830.1 Bug family tripartite tricarboxylate transporter substrate binding protein [Rhodoferax sp.]MDP1938579.1 Bug family tripartite tricarboxylate transporter substrate binding protein [Hylemonella sp.]